MQKITVATDSINANGTSLIGYLKMKRSDLVKLIGEPIYINTFGSDKICCEWNIEITDEHGNTSVVTIYDWKNYSNVAMNDNYNNWNIGGKSRMALTLLQDFINQEGVAGITRNYY